MAQHTCYADSPVMPLTCAEIVLTGMGARVRLLRFIVSDDRPCPTSGFGISATTDIPNPMRGIWSEQYGNTCQKRA